MPTVVVTGTQWGDEGKGKIVDYLAQQAETVVRFQGGSNAGHTVVAGGEEYKLRLMPSGILYKGSLCVIGNGVAFDPMTMLEEMDALAARGIDLSGIRISDRAHVVLPYHRLMDGIGDEARGKGKIGTTKRGIGPCYMDRDNRIGIRVCDLIEKDTFAKKLKTNLELKNRELKALYHHEPLDYDEVLKEYEGYAERLRPYICDTIALINEEIRAGKKILFEGAQATMLDIDYGTYPYVTASHPFPSAQVLHRAASTRSSASSRHTARASVKVLSRPSRSMPSAIKFARKGMSTASLRSVRDAQAGSMPASSAMPASSRALTTWQSRALISSITSMKSRCARATSTRVNSFRASPQA